MTTPRFYALQSEQEKISQAVQQTRQANQTDQPARILTRRTPPVRTWRRILNRIHKTLASVLNNH